MSEILYSAYGYRMAGPIKCQQCIKGQEFSSNWIACDVCEKWSPKKCLFLHSVQDGDLKKVDWMCKPCRKKVMDCYNESESMKSVISKLTEGNQQLKLENRALTEKLEEGGVMPEISECMSRLVVNSESLHQKIHEVKDEIVSTVVNVVTVEGSGAEAVLDKKKNVLVDTKEEIINTMVNLHFDKGQKSDTYAAAEKKKNVLIVKSLDSHNNAVSRKNELVKVLKDVPVVNTKFTG